MNAKKLTLKMAEIINNKKDILIIYCYSAPETHREPTKACFEQFSGKKEQST